MNLTLSLFVLFCGYHLSAQSTYIGTGPSELPSANIAEGGSEGPVPMSFSDPNLSAHLEPYNTQEQQATGNPANTISLVFESSVASLEEATLRVPTSEAGLSEGRAEEAGSRKIGGVLETPAAIKRQKALRSRKVSLALLLFVCLLVVGLKKLPLPKPEVPEVPVDERTPETKKRLEKARKSLPAAERLAAAVASDQSSQLLAVVQGALEEADVARLDAKARGKLDDALEALCMLQDAAIERAREIIQTDKGIPVLPPLILEGDHEGVRLEWETEQPIMTTYHSLCECSAKLSQGFDKASKRVLSGQQFKKEEDGHVLLDTAISLESLLATSSFKRHLAAVAGDLREDALSSTKLRLLEKSDMGIRNIEGHVALLRVRVALQRNTEEAAEEPVAKDRKLHMDIIEGRLKTVASLLDRLRSIAEAVRASTSVKAAREAAAEAADLEDQAHALLEQCLSSAYLFLASPESIEGDVKVLMEKDAEERMTTAEAENLVVSKVVQEASSLIASARGKASGKGTFPFNDGVFRYLLSSAKNISARGKEHFGHMRSSAHKLIESHSAAHAVDALQRINAAMLTTSLSKFQAESLMLRCRLLAFLQEDMKYVVSEAERIATRCSHLSDLEKQKYGELKKQLSAALNAAQSAPTLVDAARAAGDARTYVLALQDLALESSGRDGGFES